MPLTVGVLIIGSLYWRPEGRDRWRRWRLDSDNKWLVKAPIRYGRRSQNQTYTMIFSPEHQEDQFGQAVVVQCRRDVACAPDLIREAEWLWSAEDNKVPSLAARHQSKAFRRHGAASLCWEIPEAKSHRTCSQSGRRVDQPLRYKP